MPFRKNQPTCKDAINLGSHESYGLRLLQQEVRLLDIELSSRKFDVRHEDYVPKVLLFLLCMHDLGMHIKFSKAPVHHAGAFSG